MPVEASNGPRLEAAGDGMWRLRGWASRRIAAGVLDRHADPSRLADHLPGAMTMMGAAQVHGGSAALIEPAYAAAASREAGAVTSVPGCDALLTSAAGAALLVRSADCLPVWFADPSRGAVGVAHAGWRGLAASLLPRVVAAFRRAYRSESRDLSVAIGPGIRPCCFEVGPDFSARFGPFVRGHGETRTCDLIGIAIEQLRGCGVKPARITDTRSCTSCETERWFSLRREGPATGRLVSFIMLQP